MDLIRYDEKIGIMILLGQLTEEQINRLYDFAPPMAEVKGMAVGEKSSYYYYFEEQYALPYLESVLSKEEFENIKQLIKDKKEEIKS